MKRFYKFLMPLVAIVALALPVRVMAQDTVTIGTGTSTTSNVPFSSLWGYSFVEQVYPAESIDMAGQITNVQFYLGQSYSSAQTNTITLYMKNVTRSSFSSTSDVEPVTASDVVFSGSWTIPANYIGWVDIELDNPFDYDGSSNLMVAMHESTSGYSTRYFTYTSVTNSGVRFYSDSYNPDPYNLSGYSGSSATISTLANMRLAIIQGNISCYSVKNLTASNIGPWSCTLTWSDTSNSGATYTVISLPDSTVLSSGITDTTVDLTGLTADSSHIFGVIADCGGGDESMARSITVHTLVSCPNPTLLTLDSITPTDAYIHWTPGLNETEWYLTIGDSAVGSITDTFYTITDLNPNTVYNLHLRAVCGADDSSIVTSLAIHTLASEPISTFPYTCGFELTDDGDQAADWVLENIGQTNQWYIGAPGAHNGTKGLFISNDNGASNAYNITSTSHVYAYAVFSFTDIGEYTISYDWKSQGESNNYDWLRVFLAPLSQYFVAGSAQPLGSSTYYAASAVVPSGWAELSGRTAAPYTLAGQNTWQNVVTTFNITNPGTYKLVFMWSNDGSGGTQPPAAIDNISINLNTCPAPVDVVVDSLMPSAIDLHWTSTGEESEWAILIGDSLITGITDTFYTITDLEQYTLYTMRVYAVCGADDTSLASDPVTGRTTVSCPWPTDLTVNVHGDTADFSWTGSASAWELVVVDMGATPGSASTVYNPTTNSYQVTGLDTGFFDAYVRADCGSDGYSVWTGPVAFNHGITFMNMATTGTDTLRSCAAIVYDDGGPSGSYSSNCQSTLVILPGTPGSAVVINGTSYTESTWDYLTIYAGVGTNGEQLWSDYGVTATQTFGPFTGDAFTVVFHSDGSVTYSGFEINVACHSIDCPYANEIHAEQVSAGSAILGYSLVGLSDTTVYDDLTLVLASATDTLTLHPTSSSQAVVTGLDSNTTYTAQLFTTCGGVETDVVSCTFSTKSLPCAVIDTALTDTVIFSNSTTGTSGCLAYSSWGNTVYQTIYTAAELAAAGVTPGLISAIDLGFTASTSYAKEFTIFMGNTNTTSISDAIIEDPQTLVYGPSAHPTGTSGWQHYEFTTPFVWDGTSSILLTTFMNQPTGQSQTSSSGLTGYYVTANNTARYRYRDSQQWTTSNLTEGSGGSTYSYRAAIHFYTFGCQQQASCAAPLVALDSTTTTTAVVSILPGYQETNWTVEYRLVGDSTWTLSGTATATSYTVTGLQPAKHYEVRVTSVCDGTSFGTTVAATTKCALIVVTPTNPYFENFEGGAPVCWSQEYVHGQYGWLLGSETYVYHNSTYQHGEGAAELYQQSNTSDTAITKLITDAFDFTALTNGARLRFYNAQLQYQTYGQPTLHLYYRTDANGAWIAFDSIMTAVTDLTQHQFILPNSAAAPYYQIAFEGRCPYGYGLNVDDVLVDAAPNCSRPVIDTVIASGATATVSWTGNAASYTVSYHNFYDTVAPWTTVNATGTTTTLTGLTTGNYYEVTVTGDCGAVDGQSDPSAPAFFYVPCAGQAIPYTENFDSYTNDLCYIDDAASAFAGFDNYPYVQLPNCWMFPNQSHQGISPAALLFSDSTHAFPTTCLWINARTGRDHYTVLPLMGAPIDTLVLLFDYILSSESIEIGVVTDPNDITTFVALETLTTSGSAEHYFSNDSYTWNAGQNYYIALHTFGSYYAFIDNIEVQYQPNCMKVANVHQIGGGESSVTIDWTNSSTGATPVAYQIGYAAQGTNTVSYIVSSTKPATISGLDSLTNYTVAVRAICGAGDTAFWSDATQASTEFCDGATVATTGTPTGTSYYTPLNNYYNYTLTQTIIDSAELVGIGEIGAIAYSYNYSNPSTVKTDVNIWLQPTTKTTFSSSTDVVALDTNVAVQVYSGSLNCSQGWNYFTLSTPYTWDGHSNLLVIVDDNSGDYDGSSYVFDVSACTGYKTIQYYSDSYNPDINNLSGYSGLTSRYEYRATMKLVSCGAGCAAPAIASVTHDYQSATVTVTGNGLGYELSYGTDPSALGNTMTSTSGQFNITGLTPATQYFFAVTQECEDNVVSPAYTGYFVTDSLPCMAVSDISVVSTSYSSVTLSWTSNSNESVWEVVVYNAIDTVSATATATTYTVTGLTSGVAYMADVRALCGSNHNIEGPWSEAPVSFTTDICQPVTGVTVSGVTANSATVSWNAAGEGSGSYRVEYGYTGMTQGQGTSATATTNSYTIEGLESQTMYDVYVANICTETLVSAWSTVVTFETGNAGIADVDSEGNLSLYPNPASAMVTVSVSGVLADAEVAIVDLNGRTVASFKLEGTSGRFDAGQLAKGAYFVRLTGEQATAVRKLIVK